jgi:hypothetical protein
MFTLLSLSRGLTPQYSGRAQYPINQEVCAGEVMLADLQGSRDSVVGIATGYGWTTEWSEFESQ